MKMLVLSGLAVGAAVYAFGRVGWGRTEGLGMLAFLASLTVNVALQVAHSSGEPRRWRPRRRLAMLSSQGLATYLPVLWIGPQALTTAFFLAGSMLLAISGPLRWPSYLAVGVSVPAIPFVLPIDGGDPIFDFAFTVFNGLAVYGLSSLASHVAEVHATRGEAARVAVMRERMRVARDLHDLIGHHVSALMLKSELAYRLLPLYPEDARAELNEVVNIARRIRAEARVVVIGDQDLSLAAELESARSTLSSAEVGLGAKNMAAALPRDVDNVLAIVLREAVTNVLRHSKARWCAVECATGDGMARLLVVNDGSDRAPATPGSDTGSGLRNLVTRLESMGGRLSAEDSGDGCFRLTAEVPMAASGADGDRKTEELETWAPRMALLITLVILAGGLLISLVQILWWSPDGIAFAGAVASLAVVFVVQLAHTFRQPRTWSWRLGALTLSVQAIATYLPVVWLGAPLGSIGGFLAGSMLLVVAGAWRWWLYAAVGASVLGLMIMSRARLDIHGYIVIATLLAGLIVYGISLLWAAVSDAHATRRGLAWTAVKRERSRVAGDLHRLLDHDLSIITLRCERAREFLSHSPDRARAELLGFLDIVRRAVAEVRAVASAYRRTTLLAEAECAVSTLTAAEIDVRADLLEDAIPEELDAVLAIALREAVTNVLGHSDARWCVIEATADNDTVRLRVVNDGVATSPATPLDHDGLDDLAARLGAIGGSVTAGAKVGGRFEMVAEAPAAPFTGMEAIPVGHT